MKCRSAVEGSRPPLTNRADVFYLRLCGFTESLLKLSPGYRDIWGTALRSLHSITLFITLTHWAIASGAVQPTVGDINGQVMTSMNQSLDKAERATAFTFEPFLVYHMTEKQNFSLYSAINRPTDNYQPFSIPKTILTYRSVFAWLPEVESAWRVYVNAVDVTRWSSDGYQMRVGVAADLATELLPGLVAYVRFGPYAQASRYNQDSSGRNLPRYGFNERLGLTYENGPFRAEAILVVDQSNNGVWVNDYDTTEQISVEVHENIRLGAAHHLVSSLVDDSTGYYRPVRLLSGRDSRFSIFATVLF